jgi:hypothetical protein
VTYFIRADSDPWDADAERELDAWRECKILAVAHGQEIGCLFPDDHEPGHPISMRFRVSIRDAQGRRAQDWEELTEAEIQARYDAGATGASFSSQFDFWWD